MNSAILVIQFYIAQNWIADTTNISNKLRVNAS